MKRFFKITFGGIVSFFIYIALSVTDSLVLIIPIILFGWLGWFIGKRIDDKKSQNNTYNIGLGLLGLLFGCIASILLSFAFLPCGIFGC